MVNVYDSVRDFDGNSVHGRTKLFVADRDISEDGSIKAFTAGLSLVIDRTGTQYVVDEFVVDQIDKIRVVDGGLAVKEGEELIIPEKDAKEIKRQQLLAELAALDSGAE